MIKFLDWLSEDGVFPVIIFLLISNIIGLLYLGFWWSAESNPDSFLADLHVIIRIPLNLVLLISCAILASIIQMLVALLSTGYYIFVKWLYNRYYFGRNYSEKKMTDEDHLFTLLFWAFTFSILNLVIAFKYHTHFMDIL